MKLDELPYAINEEIKTLRTNIQFSGSDKKVILLTSAQANEGKSTIGLYLALAFAQLGKKVMLFDADLRKSVLQEKYVKNPEVIEGGLSHYLCGQADFSKICYCVENQKFYIAFAGVTPPNPTELLSSKMMANAIESARQVFDYVIVDTAPVGMVIDAAVLAPYCDGAVIVLDAGRVKYKVAQNVVKAFKNTGTPVLGVVMNKVGESHNGKYYGYGKYGYYRKYGKYGKYGKYEKYGK